MFVSWLLFSIASGLCALVVGALALSLVWTHMPAVALELFRLAGGLRDRMLLADWSPELQAALRFFTDERQIVYLGFVLASHVLIAIAAALLARAARSRSMRSAG